MTDHAVPNAGGHRWYSRPVLFVADLNRAVRFYGIDAVGLRWIEQIGCEGLVEDAGALIWGACIGSDYRMKHERPRDFFIPIPINGSTR